MASLPRPDGCRLYFELHGAPTSPPVILLEGLGGGLPGWVLTDPRLSRALFVIGYDFRGSDGSDDPSGPCSMTTFVDDTVAFLDELGMIELILAATHSGGPHAIRIPARAPKDKPYPALYGEAFVKEHPDRMAEDLRIDAMQPQHPSGKRRQWEAMQSFDAFDRLPSLQMPVLALHGTDDPSVAPANAEILAARILGAALRWLPGAGHRYRSEQPEAADGAVLESLGAHADA